MKERRERLRRLRQVPVLPTLLTSGNLACGVTAIFCAASSHGLLLEGAILIFAAMVCDMLDGKVARMTGATGDFGAELDSLADIVSFGVAPAILVHRLVLGAHPQRVWGEGETLIWAIALIYAIFTAIRLARYNVEHGKAAGEETKTFSGLPSPGAASFLVAWVLFYAWYVEPARYAGSAMDLLGITRAGFTTAVKLVLLVSTPVVALLMVSKIRFPHIGNTLLGDRIDIRRFILLLLLIVLVAVMRLYGVVLMVTVYILLGLIPGIPYTIRRWRGGHDILGDEEDEDEDGSGPHAAAT